MLNYIVLYFYEGWQGPLSLKTYTGQTQSVGVRYRYLCKEVDLCTQRGQIVLDNVNILAISLVPLHRWTIDVPTESSELKDPDKQACSNFGILWLFS